LIGFRTSTLTLTDFTKSGESGDDSGFVVVVVDEIVVDESRSVVEDKPEHVMLDEVTARSVRLQHKQLGERLGRVVVRLKLTEDAYENASVEGRLSIDGGEIPLDLLEG